MCNTAGISKTLSILIAERGSHIMAKWYNYETTIQHERDALRGYLKSNGIYYELSSCFDGWHFEVKATEEQLNAINAFLRCI